MMSEFRSFLLVLFIQEFRKQVKKTENVDFKGTLYIYICTPLETMLSFVIIERRLTSTARSTRRRGRGWTRRGWGAGSLRPSSGIVFRKKFHNPLQPIPRLNILARDLQSSQRNASVQSLPLAILWKTNGSPVLWRGRGCKVLKILGKKVQFFLNTLNLYI